MPDTTGSTPSSRRSSRDAKPDEVCPVSFCPIGLALTTVNRTSPDVIEHLLLSAREFLLAARSVIESRTADVESAEPRLERIEIG